MRQETSGNDNFVHLVSFPEKAFISKCFKYVTVKKIY